MANIYKNASQVDKVIGSPTGGSITVKPSHYVLGAYFSRYSPSILTTLDYDDVVDEFEEAELDLADYIDFTQAPSVLDGAIDTEDIADEAVTIEKLDPDIELNDFSGSIGTSQIDDLAVTSDKIAADAVIESKILDGAVTYNKIANDSIDENHIVNNAVGAAALATGAVTNGKIFNGAVNSYKTYLLADATGVLNIAIPANATDTGTAGRIVFDATHVYFCIATNVWVRAAIATW